MRNEAEILLKLIDGQLALIRHYEEQRSTVTNFILVAASLAIGFLTQKGISLTSIPVTILLIVLGIYGAVTVTKLYERTQFSSAFIKHYTNLVNELYPDAGIAAVREKVRAEHRIKFPTLKRLHMYQLWGTLHIVIALTGVFLTIAILVKQ
jgi:hypothetical protein